MRIHYLACLVPVLIIGCTSATSTDVKTTGISADYAVTTFEDQNDAAIRATFTIGSTYLDLQGGDAVFCDGVALNREKNLLGQIEYKGSLPRKAPGQIYTFELRRSGETLRSTVAQPAPIGVAAPAKNADLRASAATTVQWTNAGAGTNIAITQDKCLEGARFDVPGAPTSFSIPAGAIRFAQGKTGPCNDATLTVRRGIAGKGASTFKSETIEAATYATVPVHVLP